MSIEKEMSELAEALRENSELLRGLTAKAKGEVGKTSTTKASSKDDDEEDKPKRTRTTKPKAPTAKEIAAATTAYLEVEDEDEYDKRKGIVRKIVDKYDVAKMSEIGDEDRVEAMALLQLAIEGKNPFKKARDEDDMA